MQSLEQVLIWFRSLYIGSGIWQTIGWSSIIYTSTLAGVSQDLIEAAKIDGATIIQQIRNVELPALKPVIVIQFILSAGNIMSIGFEKVYAMQTDLNKITSDIIPTYVYRLGLEMGDYGYSTAVGLFNSIVNLILLVAVWIGAGKKRYLVAVSPLIVAVLVCIAGPTFNYQMRYIMPVMFSVPFLAGLFVQSMREL